MIRPALVIGVSGLTLLSGVGAAVSSTGSPVTPAQARSLLAQAVPAAEEPTQEVVNDEVVLAELDPTGLPERAVLVSRVTVPGPEREVIDPASTTNVRYLDRLGRPQVSAQGVVLRVGGQRPRALTEARFDQPLPVAVHAEYARDGQVVPAVEIPGAEGQITVTYTLSNTTAVQTELTYEDAAGRPQQVQRPAFIPFQGSLTVTLPETAELVSAPGATLETDEQGHTIARWNVALFPPISEPIQQLELTLRTQRAAVPGVQVLLNPTGTGQDPAADFSADLLTSSVAANTEVYDGLATLDSAARYLASGSDQLATGLSDLAAGASAAGGASQSLAEGVGTLAEGADAAATASDTLAEGVGGISDGAGEVAAGSQQLAGALGAAAGGAQLLSDVTAEFARAASSLLGSNLDPLIDGGAQIEAGLREAAARIGGPDDPVLDLTEPIEPDNNNTCPAGGTAPPDDDCVTIYQGVRALRDALEVVEGELADVPDRLDDAQEALLDLGQGLDSISADAADAAQGSRELYDALCTGPAPTLGPDSCTQLAGVADSAGSASSTADDVLPDMEALLPAIAALDELADAVALAVEFSLRSTQRLLIGVAAAGLAVGEGTAGQPGLAAGMAALNAGISRLAAQLDDNQATLTGALELLTSGAAGLAAGIEDSSAGAQELAAGSRQLAEGAQDAATGAQTLAQGSAELSAGAQGAAAGADQLSSGLTGLAGGARDSAAAGQQLATGASSLQQEGTGPASAQLLDASVSAAVAQAWLEASTARALDALPYGPPAGAQGNVAYLFTLDEVPAPKSFWERIRAVFGG